MLILTHEGDSPSCFRVIHHGKRAGFFMAAAIELRADFTGDDLRRLARDSGDAKQVRRLLALAVVLDGGTRTEAARLARISHHG